MSTETDPTDVVAEAAGGEPATGSVPNRATRWAGSQARRAGDGARHLGAWLGHWASTADQSGEEIRRRIIADQLEAHNDRRTNAEDALTAEVKKIVRLEEEASDGGLTQAQRGDLTFRREAARRLEKSLNEMRKDRFRPLQPTERQIARARSLGRLRRGAALLGAATALGMLAFHQPAIALLGVLAVTGLAWWTGTHPPRLTHRPIPEDLLLPELAPPTTKSDIRSDALAEEAAVTVPEQADPALVCAETTRLTAAMLATGAITKGAVRLADPDAITRMPGGWMARIILPQGDGANAETVMGKLGKIAAEMGSDRVRFFMEPVHASAGGNAKTVAVASFTTDPFTAPRPSPLVGASGVDVWAQGIPVAVDAFGQIVHLVVKDTSLALAGASRTGKGAALRGIIGGALLDLRVNVRLIDGKAPGQDRWRDLVATFIDEPSAKDGAKRTRHLLEAEVAEMDRRAAILKRHGMEQIDAPALIDELGGLELVVIDEVQRMTSDKKHGNAIKDALAALAARGLAFGIILVLATQVATKGESGVLPRLVTGNISWKWCMRVTETGESNMALSPGAAGAGWDASKLDPGVKGMGILFGDAGYRRIRSLWIDGPDMLHLIDTATTLRASARRLRGQWDDPIEKGLAKLGSATPSPRHNATASQGGWEGHAAKPDGAEPGHPAGVAGEDRDLLALTAEWFGEQTNVLCRQVAEVLPLVDQDRWAHLTTATVGDAFRRAGVFRKTVRVDGQSPTTGARLDDIRAALTPPGL